MYKITDYYKHNYIKKKTEREILVDINLLTMIDLIFMIWCVDIDVHFSLKKIHFLLFGYNEVETRKY
jgi:hypothetical protein